MKIRVREASLADAAAIARVHVDTRRSSYAGILTGANLADFSYLDSERMWNETLNSDDSVYCMFVAETHTGEVIGFANGIPERGGSHDYLGEVFAVYVLREHQRSGVGRDLFLAVARRFLELGVCSILLWVFKENHQARRFYESMAGKYLDQKTVTIGGTEHEMVSYGWKNLANLVAGAADR